MSILQAFIVWTLWAAILAVAVYCLYLIFPDEEEPLRPIPQSQRIVPKKKEPRIAPIFFRKPGPVHIEVIVCKKEEE